MAYGTSPNSRTKWVVPGIFIGAIGLGLLFQSGAIEFGGTPTGELADSETDALLGELGDFDDGEPLLGAAPLPDGSGTMPGSDADVAAAQSEPAPTSDPLAGLDLNSSADAPTNTDSNPFWDTTGRNTASTGLNGLTNTSPPPAVPANPPQTDPRATFPQPGIGQPNGNTLAGGQPNGGVGNFPGFTPPNTNSNSPAGQFTPPPNNPLAGLNPQGQPAPHIASRTPVIPISNTNAQPAASPAPMIPADLEPAIDKVDMLLAQNKIIDAHRELSRVYWTRPDARDAIASMIDSTSRQIFFDSSPHFMPSYKVQPGEMLGSIAKKYDLPWEYLAKLNRISDASRIRPGQELKVNRGPFSAVVELSRRELTIHCHNYVVRRYRIGIGRDNGTPVGTFTVADKTVKPTWTDPTGRQVRATDPGYPLGTRYLALAQNGVRTSYAIHGTDEPASIGHAQSAGCVRMINEEVEIVYDLLGVGSEVLIRP